MVIVSVGIRKSVYLVPPKVENNGVDTRDTTPTIFRVGSPKKHVLG